MKQRIRIKDIAARSGVSTGTVDRVIHERGNVAPEVRDKVLEVMEELNYQPNILARTLANNKLIRIATLLPDFHGDPYWMAHQEGISAALQDHHHYGVVSEAFYFNYLDSSSFVSQSKALLAALPDAVLLAPIFHHEAVEFSKQCQELGICVVTINTDIAFEGNLSYIGQDSYQSGKLAGRLLDNHFTEKDTLIILHMEPDIDNAVHLLNKERGFRDYYAANQASVQIHRFGLEYSLPDLPEIFREIVHQNRPVKGVFVSSSRAYIIAPLLREYQATARLVGFDLIDDNIRFLRSGHIHFLINQNPEKQGYQGIARIIHHLVLKKAVPAIQYLPLDIIVPENVDYYISKKP